MASPIATLNLSVGALRDLPNLTTPTIAGVAGVILLAAILYSFSQPKVRYPPGPKGLPFIGSLLDLPKEHHWHYYKKIAEQYGTRSSYSTQR